MSDHWVMHLEVELTMHLFLISIKPGSGFGFLTVLSVNAPKSICD